MSMAQDLRKAVFDDILAGEYARIVASWHGVDSIYAAMGTVAGAVHADLIKRAGWGV